jgi:putative DNA primase/helicase
MILHDLAEHGLVGVPQLIDESGQKRPLVKWAEYQKREPTGEEVAGWIRHFPDAGAGILTGPRNGLLVLDTDSPDAIEWVELRGIPETVLVRTLRGIHYYFKYPLGLQVNNSASAIAPGIDIRGSGGMATAAGTRRPDGFIYHYDRGHALGEVNIAEAPEWLINWLLLARANRQRATMPLRAQKFDGKVDAWASKVIDETLRVLAGASSGQRNDLLSRAAFKLGQLVGGGEADDFELLAALYAITNTWPDEHAKSADTITRCFKAGFSRPRQRPLRNVVWLEPSTADTARQVRS